MNEYKSKNPDDYLFFWGGLLSNWARTSFMVHSQEKNRLIEFNTSEQYMMYMKAILFGDSKTAEKILQEKNPREQKALGRQVKGYNEVTWTEKREDIMYEGLKQKFMQNPDAYHIMAASVGKILVEASPHDRIWGIGFLEVDAMKDIDNWGQNLLGKLLMKVRDKIC